MNILTGFGSRLRSRADEPSARVAKIAFTGGPETARHIVRNSAENLAATSLELGGKSPVLVFDDADLDSVSNAVIAGIFAATGQSCVAGSRLLVQRGIRDRLLIETGRESAGNQASAIRRTWIRKWARSRRAKQRDHIEIGAGGSLAAGATL